MTHKEKKSKRRSSISKEARQLLGDPKFLFNASKRVERLGLVGENLNRLIVIVAGMSRTLPEPLSVLVKGPTSCGKSTIVKTSLRLFPSNCIVERAGLSRRALAYGKMSLTGKILFVTEFRCGKEAQQLLRLLQSEGKITHEYATSKAQKRTTATVQRVGRPVVLTTTTDEEVFADDETRFLSAHADQSPEQTLAIVVARAQKRKIIDDSDLPIWQAAMSLLRFKKGDFEHHPKWLKYVAQKLPLDRLRVRRDWSRCVSFCSAIALWRSFGKSGPTEITFEDYCIAHTILEPVLVSKNQYGNETAHEIANTVAKLKKRLGRAVTVGEIAENLGLNKKVVYKRIKYAIKKRLIRYESGTREKNEKRLRPVKSARTRFLPSPRSVLRHHPELGHTVEIVDPLTGKRREIHR